MIQNNNYSSLPVYTSRAYQYHRNNVSGLAYHHPASATKILPFEAIRSTPSGDPLTTVYAYRLDDTTFVDLSATLPGKTSQVATLTYDVIKYPASSALAVTLDVGLWYLYLTDGTYEWWSEVFTVTNDLDYFLKLEFWANGNLLYTGGQMDYTGGFRQRVYLSASVSRPKYPIEVKSETRKGYEFDEEVTSKKSYSFQFAAPEFLCDLLCRLRNHDYIEITSQGIVYTVFKATPIIEWPDGSEYADVVIEFDADTIIHTYGKMTEISGKDFNNDFNPDFNAGT